MQVDRKKSDKPEIMLKKHEREKLLILNQHWLMVKTASTSGENSQLKTPAGLTWRADNQWNREV